MTWSFLKSIKENNKITWNNLVENMRSLLKTSNYKQIPLLSADENILDQNNFL
jgi:hypothetical protein